MSDRLLGIYEKVVLSHPLISLLVVFLVAVAMGFGLPNFKLDASADSLTLEHDTDLDYFRENNQRYGTGDFLLVTFRPKHHDLFSDESLQILQALNDDLAEVEGVQSITSILDVPLLYSPLLSVSDLKEEPRTLLTEGVDRAAAKKEFMESPIYRDLILGPDGQTTAVMAMLELDHRYIELVRHRDALRLKRDNEGLSAEEQLELKRVSQEFLAYRTEGTKIDHERVDYVRKLLDGYRDDVELFLGGPSMITADMIAFIKSDLRIFGAGVVIFIIAILAIIFRQLRWVILPLVTCLLTLEIILGYLSWIDWRLTVISSNFVSLLLIITLALTIHLVVRYREAHATNPEFTQIQLVREMVTHMARPCLYTVLTTVVAFMSLVVSDIRPVIDFGWMMTMGLVLAFVMAFVIIPSGLMLIGKGKNEHKRESGKPLTLKFAYFTEHHGKLVLLLSFSLAVVSAWGISQLKVDNRFIDYFRSDTELHQGMLVIDANLGGTTPLDIILTAPKMPEIMIADDAEENSPYGGGFEDPFGGDEYSISEEDSFAEEDPFASDDSFSDDPFAEDPFGDDAADEKPVENSYWFTTTGLEDLEKLHDFLESLPEVGKVSSLVTVYDVASDLMGHRLNDLELALVRQSLTGENAEFMLDPYIDDELQQARITLRTRESDGDLKRSELLEKIHSYAIDEIGFEEEQVRFTGLLVLYNNMLQSLFRSQILTLGAVFVGIMIMFMVLFRSISISMIAILPNMLAASVVIGGMGVAGIPLDMMTITIAAITVGIGVDDTIHYIHRFREEFAVDRNYRDAMYRSHGSIGRAMYYTSVIIVVGFSILALSNFIPTVYFGLLTGFAMMAALSGAMILLPKLILMFKPLGKEEQGKEERVKEA